jgi:hypothetical protein
MVSETRMGAASEMHTIVGFKRESDLMRDRLLVAGEFRGVLVCALLAPEWRR